MGCHIVGDPQHDIINLGKVLHFRAAEDLQRDHIDMVRRLSAPDIPVSAKESVPDVALSGDATALLESACVDPFPIWREQMVRLSASLEEVKSFLALPRIQECEVWRSVFGAFPPRGTVARIARRLDVRLHATAEPYGWRSQKAFRREARRIVRWYRKGRKNMRRNISLPRSDSTPEYVKGLKTAWTGKVNLHFKRFLGPIRQEGLWAWRRMSRALRMAGICQQSGTVSVERVWSYYKAEFPVANRVMTQSYFNVLSALLFVRFTLGHVKAGRLPGWLEDDGLAALKLDTLVCLARACLDEEDSEMYDFGQVFA